MKHRAIALLITMLFIIAITVSVGVGMKQINSASKSVASESFMIQTSVILDDVLALLKASKELDFIIKSKSPEAFYIFLAQAGFIPFESSGIKVTLEIASARSKFNPNELYKNTKVVGAFQEYLNLYGINVDYIPILLDGMGEIKEDMSYNSDIFNENPYLFRNYLTSFAHLNEINNFYIKTYRENSINRIDFEKLFYFYKDTKNYRIDVNYATKEVWQMMLGCDLLRAEQLVDEAGSYTKIDDLLLSDSEKVWLSKFKVSYFEPIIDVRVELMQEDLSAKIRFEYDIKSKKGTNFVYEI